MTCNFVNSNLHFYTNFPRFPENCLLLQEYLHYQINKKEESIKNVKVKVYPQNNTERSKFVVIGDSIPKYLKPNDLVSRENFVKVPCQSRASTEYMLDYIKSLVRKKPDTIIIHTGTNDVTNGVKTVNNVKKLAQYNRENDGDKKI